MCQRIGLKQQVFKVRIIRRSGKDCRVRVQDSTCCLCNQFMGVRKDNPRGPSKFKEQSGRVTLASRRWSSLFQGPNLVPCRAGGKTGVPNSGVMGPCGWDKVLDEFKRCQICTVCWVRSPRDGAIFRQSTGVHGKAHRPIRVKCLTLCTHSLVEY